MVKRQDATARLQAERAALERIKARATPPEACGDAIPVAPGRGPMATWEPRELQRTEVGNWRDVRAGYAGRMGARCADVFDLMTREAQKAHLRKGAGTGFVAPFTVAQVETARRYAALVERVEASGVKLAGIERSDGGGGGNGREAALLDDIRRLRRVRGRIGEGLAKDVLRAAAGRRPRPIRVRVLVDMVCIANDSLDAVARRHGWAPKGQLRAELRMALCAALDRVYGYI